MPRLLSEMTVAVAVVTPTSDNQTSALDTQLSQANFDTNMVIVLAALLCSLICALGLNSIVRCVLRCGHRFGMETTEQAAAQMTSGLKKSTLRKLPVVVYEANNMESNTSTDPSEIECPICLGEFIDGEKVRVLPKCNHRFHVSCIDTWLGSHSSCPNCRHSVLEAVGISSLKVAQGESSDNSGGVPARGGGDSSGQHEHVVVEVSGGC